MGLLYSLEDAQLCPEKPLVILNTSRSGCDVRFGIEAADFSNDGRLDLVLARRYGLDRLLLGE